ncbi:hypothetical protein HPB48_007379 [Haemaphysalis longicornis]|uniref:Uncharacterized protein n=1 Tax=Haemaphysalis longicornis TaxID=44386 RepID=A0A9J6G754_HAELO|nr:hypothetical protein HPB48_007379 [Haemaphysalis longicornis]
MRLRGGSVQELSQRNKNVRNYGNEKHAHKQAFGDQQTQKRNSAITFSPTLTISDCSRSSISLGSELSLRRLRLRKSEICGERTGVWYLCYDCSSGTKSASKLAEALGGGLKSML